jgi:deazaflavin-dependent oxidoreductase (nitroreductase family)
MKEVFLYLTTTGWKSGKPHEIEIWFIEHAENFYLCAEHRDQSHWVQNVQHNAAVSFRVEDQTWQGTGRIVQVDETTLLAAISEKFYQKYEWSDGLFVELVKGS